MATSEDPGTTDDVGHQGPMAALEQAIKAADTAKVSCAYSHLTEVCNICHQSAKVGEIVLKIPGSSPFSQTGFPDR
jgi:hypothetical protein